MPFTLYNCANVDSTKALQAPSKAIIHIQNTAPGPPTAMAVATPARFPVPTLLARETIKASKEEICFFPSCELLEVESPRSLTISPNILNWTNFVFTVKYNAHPISIAIRIYVHRTSLMEPIIEATLSIEIKFSQI